jgi:predicted SprT family Zn-dependent metalloprotease
MWLKIKGQKTSSSSLFKYTCQYCENELPLSVEYFDRVKAFKTGYGTVCKECSKPKQREG